MLHSSIDIPGMKLHLIACTKISL